MKIPGPWTLGVKHAATHTEHYTDTANVVQTNDSEFEKRVTITIMLLWSKRDLKIYKKYIYTSYPVSE